MVQKIASETAPAKLKKNKDATFAHEQKSLDCCSDGEETCCAEHKIVKAICVKCPQLTTLHAVYTHLDRLLACSSTFICHAVTDFSRLLR